MGNAGDHIYTVINAGHEDKDIPHIRKEMEAFGGDVQLEMLTDNGLLALQGPSAVSVLQTMTDVDYTQMGFMTGRTVDFKGIGECYMTRSGYTGEDGFEIAVSNDKVRQLWDMLT